MEPASAWTALAVARTVLALVLVPELLMLPLGPHASSEGAASLAGWARIIGMGLVNPDAWALALLFRLLWTSCQTASALAEHTLAAMARRSHGTGADGGQPPTARGLWGRLRESDVLLLQGLAWTCAAWRIASVAVLALVAERSAAGGGGAAAVGPAVPSLPPLWLPLHPAVLLLRGTGNGSERAAFLIVDAGVAATLAAIGGIIHALQRWLLVQQQQQQRRRMHAAAAALEGADEGSADNSDSEGVLAGQLRVSAEARRRLAMTLA